MVAPMPVDGRDPLRAMRERIVELVGWFRGDPDRLPAAQAAWRRDELWDPRVDSEVDRWQVLMDRGLPLPLASLAESSPAGVLFELECLDHLAWLFAGAVRGPAPRFRRDDREYYLVRLARERRPHTARQAGLILTHLRHHALVPVRIPIDDVRWCDVRIDPGSVQLWGSERWLDITRRNHVRVAAMSFADEAPLEWSGGTVVGVPTAGERAAKLEHAIQEAAAGGVDILVAPELTVPPAERDRVLRALRWSDPELALLVPGSFHERVAKGTVNRALLADGKGNTICEHRKLVMFGDNDGELETIALGNEVRILVTPIGTVAIAICKDFCDHWVGQIWQQLQVEWLLVPAYGRGADAHEAAAARVARMVATTIILAHEGKRSDNPKQHADPNSFVFVTNLAKPDPAKYPKAPKYFDYLVDLADDPAAS